MDHPGSLAHSPDGNGLAAQFKLYRNFFFLCVRRHDGFRRQGSGCLTVGEHRNHRFDSGLYHIHGKLFPDHAGGSGQYLKRIQVQQLCSCFGGLLTVAIPFRSGTGIGDSAVHNHCLGRLLMIHDILIPFYRSSLYYIGGESPCRCAGRFAVEHRHVLFSLFDPGCDADRLESFRGGDAPVYDLHFLISSYESCHSPIITETAAPAADLSVPATRITGSYFALPVLPLLLPDCQ